MTHYDSRPHDPPASFSWGHLIAQLKLDGIPALIASHCEPKQYDAFNTDGPYLKIELDHRLQALQKSPSMTQFKNRLIDYFGETLSLDVEVGHAEKSPAALASKKKVGERVQALEAIMGDSIVQDLINKGATVVVESVQVTRAHKP